MNSPSPTLFATDAGWTLLAAPHTQTLPFTTLQDLAQKSAAFFQTHAPKNASITLALPSNAFLPATLATDDLPKGKSRRDLLTYRLEEHLPLPAEDFVADFTDTAPDCLAVAAETAKVRPILAALESAGLRVDTLAPTAILHAAAAAQSPDFPDPALLLLQSAPHCLDLLRLHDKTPRQWLSFPNTPQDAKRNLAILRRSHPDLPLHALNVDAALLAHLPSPSCLRASVPPCLCPTLNLLRGPLAPPRAAAHRRRPIAAAALAATLLLLTIPATLLYRSRQYNTITTNEQLAQERLFKQTLPAQSVPLDIPARLASEHRRLAAVTGSAPDAGPSAPPSSILHPPSSPPALLVLHQTLAALPTTTPRYRLFDLSIDAGRFTLEGQSPSHADATTLASALRAAHLQVDDPHTQQLTDNSVSFTLTGSLPPPSSPSSLLPLPSSAQ